MMKNAYLKIASLLLLLTLLWVQAESIEQLTLANIWQYRSALIQLSGMIAVTLMAIVILLALRVAFIERLTNGLDKSYHLHKWLGISALITAVIHWLLAVIPKYLVAWEVISKPLRGPHNIVPNSLHASVSSLRSSAEQLGEWFFYAILILGVISLLNKVGYKFFKISHKLMALSFIVIAYHSAVLIKHSYWDSTITYIVLAIILIGVAAAIWSLLGNIGKKKTYQGKVCSYSHDPINQTTDLRLSIKGWRGHQSGQFAYINFGQNNIHPFTIANEDTADGELRFLIKELGDFTCELKSVLYDDQKIEIEGPYGKFNFNDTHDQLWIAGGIGIAAFKAALQSGKNSSSRKKSITLYYCTLKPSNTLINELKHEAKLANINLEVFDGCNSPLLSAAMLKTTYSDLKQRSIWFCGPVSFSNKLKRDLSKMGYNLDLFHQEYFSMR